MKTIAKLKNNGEVIGYLKIIEDKNGGGLNGGVFFGETLHNFGSTLTKQIPLFEEYEIISDNNDFKLELFNNINDVSEKIKQCEGNHIQQCSYSSYHNSLTQVCFDCKKIRTNIEISRFKEEEPLVNLQEKANNTNKQKLLSEIELWFLRLNNEDRWTVEQAMKSIKELI